MSFKNEIKRAIVPVTAAAFLLTSQAIAGSDKPKKLPPVSKLVPVYMDSTSVANSLSNTLPDSALNNVVWTEPLEGAINAERYTSGDIELPPKEVVQPQTRELGPFPDKRTVLWDRLLGYLKEINDNPSKYNIMFPDILDSATTAAVKLYCIEHSRDEAQARELKEALAGKPSSVIDLSNLEREGLTAVIARLFNDMSSMHGTIAGNRDENPRMVLYNLEKDLVELLKYDYEVDFPDTSVISVENQPQETQPEDRKKSVETTTNDGSFLGYLEAKKTNPNLTYPDYLLNKHGYDPKEGEYHSGFGVTAFGFRPGIQGVYDAGRFSFGAGIFKPKEDESNKTTVEGPYTSSPRPGYKTELTRLNNSNSKNTNMGGMINIGYEITPGVEVLVGAVASAREYFSEKITILDKYLREGESWTRILHAVEKTPGTENTDMTVYPTIGTRVNVYKGFGLEANVSKEHALVGVHKRFGDSRTRGGE